MSIKNFLHIYFLYFFFITSLNASTQNQPNISVNKTEKINVGVFDQFYEMYDKYTNKAFEPDNEYKTKTRLSYNLIFDILNKKK